MGVTHITLLSVPVTDQDVALGFYRRLGFEVVNDHVMGPEEMPPEPGLRWLQLGTPGGGCTLTLVTWDVGGLRPGTQQFSVAADDVRALHEELTAQGAAVQGPVIDAPFGAFFSVRDPDGNSLLVVEEPA